MELLAANRLVRTHHEYVFRLSLSSLFRYDWTSHAYCDGDHYLLIEIHGESLLGMRS